jgi:hypothetical protein
MLAAAVQTVREPLYESEKTPVRAPEEIVHGLLSVDFSSRVAALKDLGVSEQLHRGPQEPAGDDLTKVSDVRLVYTNLDEGPELEAIVTTTQQSYAVAGIFRRNGDNWFRVAVLGCWCKYENDPLSRFLELAHLVDTGWEDLIVQDSLGGTGIYWRDAVVYRMKAGALREVLRVREEDRWCNTQFPGKRATYCEDTRSFLSFPHESFPRRVVVSTVKGRIPIPPWVGDTYHPLGDILEGPTPVGCKGYAWDELRFKFIENKETTALYCPRMR